MRCVPSLYQVCLEESSVYLNNHSNRFDNPFEESFPQQILENLLTCMTSKPGTSQTAISFLVATGQIRYLELDNESLPARISETVFRGLRSSAQRLWSIKVKVRDEGGVSGEFGSLLSNASNLVSLETNISLDEYNPSPTSETLMKLTLNYEIDGNTLSHVERNRSFVRSLRVLNVEEDPEDPEFYPNLKRLIERFPALVQTNCDLAQVMVQGRHRIRVRGFAKCHLGSRIFPVDAAGVETASTLFLSLNEVEVTPRNSDAILQLSAFRNLMVLKLNAPEFGDKDYHTCILPLLERPGFGQKLKGLFIRDFSRVDFSSIGANCPELSNLLVYFVTEKFPGHFRRASFTNLVSLIVVIVNRNIVLPCKRASIVGLLSNATQLEFLLITNASHFDDGVLDAILARHRLSRLKTVRLGEWGISLAGLERIPSNLTSLHTVQVNSRRITEEQAHNMLHEMPNLKVLQWDLLEQNENEAVAEEVAPAEAPDAEDDDIEMI